GFLDYILSVFFVVRDVLRDTEDVAVIPLYQLAERIQIAFLGCLDQRQLAAYFISRFILDGFHVEPTQINLLWFASKREFTALIVVFLFGDFWTVWLFQTS